MKKFSDFAEQNNVMTGDKISIAEILDKEIEIIGYKISDSKFKKTENDKLLTLQFIINDIERILFTGSNVLKDQCEKYKDEIPFATIIKKVNKFYTFS
jgi:hypothetical protein